MARVIRQDSPNDIFTSNSPTRSSCKRLLNSSKPLDAGNAQYAYLVSPVRSKISRTLEQDDQNFSAPCDFVVVISNDGRRFWFPRHSLTSLCSLQFGSDVEGRTTAIRVDSTKSTLSTFLYMVQLYNTPFPLTPPTNTTLDGLLQLLELTDTLISEKLGGLIIGWIELYAKSQPWVVLGIAARRNDLGMARSAIRGMAVSEGRKLIRGSWDPKVNLMIPSHYLIELLRLKDKHLDRIGTSHNSSSFARSPLSPTKRVATSSLYHSTSTASPRSGFSSPGPNTPKKLELSVDWDAVAREFNPPSHSQSLALLNGLDACSINR